MTLPPVKAVAPKKFHQRLLTELALDALAHEQPLVIPAGDVLRRAVWRPDAIVPMTVTSFHRFGPPPSVAQPDLALPPNPPYWWLYVADEYMTCVYEAQFTTHKRNRKGRGHFAFSKGAEAHGLLASLTFPTDIRLLDLTGDLAYQLDINDEISKE